MPAGDRSQDRALIGQAAARQAQARKLAHRCDVVERLFHRRVAQREPLLHEVDAKHRLKRVGSAPVANLRIHRLDERCEPCPGDDLIHFCQRHFAPCALALVSKLDVGKADLLDRVARRRMRDGE